MCPCCSRICAYRNRADYVAVGDHLRDCGGQLESTAHGWCQPGVSSQNYLAGGEEPGVVPFVCAVPGAGFSSSRSTVMCGRYSVGPAAVWRAERSASGKNVAKVVLGALAIVVAAILLGVQHHSWRRAARCPAVGGVLAAAGASLLWGTMYIPYRKAYISGMNPLSFVTVNSPSASWSPASRWCWR